MKFTNKNFWHIQEVADLSPRLRRLQEYKHMQQMYMQHQAKLNDEFFERNFQKYEKYPDYGNQQPDAYGGQLIENKPNGQSARRYDTGDDVNLRFEPNNGHLGSSLTQKPIEKKPDVVERAQKHMAQAMANQQPVPVNNPRVNIQPVFDVEQAVIKQKPDEINKPLAANMQKPPVKKANPPKPPKKEPEKKPEPVAKNVETPQYDIAKINENVLVVKPKPEQKQLQNQLKKENPPQNKAKVQQPNQNAVKPKPKNTEGVNKVDNVPKPDDLKQNTDNKVTKGKSENEAVPVAVPVVKPGPKKLPPDFGTLNKQRQMIVDVIGDNPTLPHDQTIYFKNKKLVWPMLDVVDSDHSVFFIKIPRTASQYLVQLFRQERISASTTRLVCARLVRSAWHQKNVKIPKGCFSK